MGLIGLILAALAGLVMLSGCGPTQQQAANLMADATLVSVDALDMAVNDPNATNADVKRLATECLTLETDANANYLAYGQFDANKASQYVQWAIQEGLILWPYIQELISVFGDEHSTPQQQALAKRHFTAAYRQAKALQTAH
jgi:hypothetical protein